MAGKRLASSFSGWHKPDFTTVVKTNKNFIRNYNGALTYAHYELTSSDLKKEVLKYLKSKNPKDPLLDKIKDVHENRFVVVGKYMYILNHGGDIPEDVLETLIPNLEKILDENEIKNSAKKSPAPELEDKATESTKLVVSIQDRLRDKAREVAGEIEGWIDDFCMDKKSSIKTVEEFINLFKIYELKAPHMRHMQNIFERRASEISEVVSGKNKELLEGYSNFTKPELKKFDQFYQNLLTACTMLQDAAKAVRVPRKKKPVSQEKLVSKLKYKKEDSSLGIVSINPIQILGSKEVWVYNTKTRKLAQYKSFDERGLGVKGSSLENYSSDSVEKTLRKPAETLVEFKKASKVKLRTFLKELSTVDVPVNGKLNENHVILRVDK